MYAIEGKDCSETLIGIKKLIKHMSVASINKKNSFGHTAFTLACSYSTEKVVELLLSYEDIDINTETSAKKYALGILYGRNMQKLVKKIIISERCDLDQFRGFNGRTILIWAIDKEDMEIIKLLVEYGASIDIQDNSGLTALMRTVDNVFKIKHYKLEILNLLIEKGANLDLQTHQGKTALILALEQYDNSTHNYKTMYIEICKLLVENGCNVHIQDKNKFNALMYATLFNIPEIVKLLERIGSKIVYGKRGWNMCHLIVRYGDKPIVTNIIKTMIANNFSVNKRMKNKVTPLICTFKYILHKGTNNIFNILMDNNCKLNLKDRQGKTALMHGIMNQPKEKVKNMVRCLLDRGAQINAQDNDGMTPLMLRSIRIKKNGLLTQEDVKEHIEMVKLLIEYGADPNIKNSEGKTYWDYELEQNHETVKKHINVVKKRELLLKCVFFIKNNYEMYKDCIKYMNRDIRRYFM